MCAPLVTSEGNVLGVIQLDTTDQRQRFDQDDLEVLASVACQAAIAVENAQLHEIAVQEASLRRELAVAHLAFVVVGICFHLADAGGRHEPHVANPIGPIREQRYEQLAGSYELVAHRAKSVIHLVLGMVPECAHEPFDVSMFAADVYAVADDIGPDQGYDTSYHEILAPGL